MVRADQDVVSRLVQDAETVGGVASEMVPLAQTWGFYSYGDAGPAMGGGIGTFLWFESRVHMLDYLGRLLAFLSPGPGSSDHLAVAAEAAGVVRRIEANELSDDHGRKELNRVLKHFSQVTWIGHYNDLLEGNGEWVRNLRSIFREGDDGEAGPDAPITGEESDGFLGFIQSYGA